MEKDLIQQSSLVTYGKFAVSGIQMNCLIQLIDSMQKYIKDGTDWIQAETKKIKHLIPLNEHEEFEISIHNHDIDNYEHKYRVVKELETMAKIIVRYQFLDKNDGWVNISHPLISSITWKDGDSNIKIGVGLHQLRWLLAVSTQLIPTTFDKKSVLSLHSPYTKRLYLILSDNYKKIIFKFSIDKLMSILQSPSYTPQDFERYILKPALKEMLANDNSRLVFKYCFTSEKPSKGRGRKGFDTVTFKIYDKLTIDWMSEFLKDDWSNRCNPTILPESDKKFRYVL